MTLELLTEVWNEYTILFAICAGISLGYLVVGHYASDPAYASGEATSVEYGVLVATLAVAIGLVFFGFQVIATFIEGDPLWTRVVSRFGIWVVYSVAIGLGTGIRLTRHTRRKRAETHARAEHELNK